MGWPDSGSARLVWKKRLTYVTTTSQNLTNRFAMVGAVISAERLIGVQVGCPRCDLPAATLWRRFDFLGRERPLYFTKCRRCHRRRSISADEAAFRLLEAGTTDPMEVLQDGIPTAIAGQETHGQVDHSPVEGDDVSVTETEQLVANRQRALGKKHPLTFAARAQLGEAVGKSGDADGAARIYEQLLVDQLAAAGHQSPAVLGNRYREAVWTAHAGLLLPALTGLQGLQADQERILGPDHANTLITRATIAQLVAETGDRDEAIQALRQVGQDQLRLLGSEHPSTEATLRLLAEWEGR